MITVSVFPELEVMKPFPLIGVTLVKTHEAPRGVTPWVDLVAALKHNFTAELLDEVVGL